TKNALGGQEQLIDDAVERNTSVGQETGQVRPGKNVAEKSDNESNEGRSDGATARFQNEQNSDARDGILHGLNGRDEPVAPNKVVVLGNEEGRDGQAQDRKRYVIPCGL